MDPKIEIKEEFPFSVSQNETELCVTMKRNSDANKTEIKSEVFFPSPCSQNEQEHFSDPLAMQIQCETVKCNNNWKIDAGTVDDDFDSQNNGEFLTVIKVEKYNNDNKIEVKAEPSSVCYDIKDEDFPLVTPSRLCTEADFGDSSGKASLSSTEVSRRDTSICNVMYHSESQDSDVTEITTVKHTEQYGKCSDGAALYFKQKNFSDKSERPQQCNITDMSHTKSHESYHCDKRLLRCNTCDKNFAWSSNLRRHNWIHEGKMPYQCKTCDKSYTQLSHLKRHTMIHEGKMPYQCKTCDKSFTQLSHLKRHELIHEGKKPHHCKTCDKRFNQLSNLKIHNLIHEGKKYYKCEICDKDFTRLSNLKIHKLTHEGKKPHKCQTCDKSFTRLSDWKRHNLTHEGK